MWNDARVQSLTWPPPNGLTLWQRLLTGPELGCIPGLFQAWEAGLAQALRWDLKGFREAFQEVSLEGLAQADWKVGLVWAPKAIIHNRPESPNVVKSWRDQWEELPECDLKLEAYQSLKDFTEGMGEAFSKAFLEACRKPSGNPSGNPCRNQEQEQEQEEISPSPRIPGPRPADPMADSLRRRAPGDRDDVKRLFERFKRSVGRPGLAFFRGTHDLQATWLADALDAHGEPACSLVADEAPNDRMVTGDADERGQDHRTVKYVFGNPDAFARILEAAKRRQRRPQQDTADVMAAAMAAEPEL
jgi:hypothetical protein